MLSARNLTFFPRRFFSSRIRDYKEISLPAPWGHISGKWWEPYDTQPILTLHGWMDNCGSFDRLIPLLKPNVGFLAIDFPGHGYSSYIPNGCYYHFVSTYVLTLRIVKDFLKWRKMSILGHSIGGMCAYLYTLFYPQDVNFLIGIDGYKPVYQNNPRGILERGLMGLLEKVEHISMKSEPPSYTWEEIVGKVSSSSDKSILPEYAKYLLERSMAPSKLYEGKFVFTRDPRVKVLDIFPFCQDELIEYSQNMTTPMFIVKFKNGANFEIEKNFYQLLDVVKQTSKDCEFHHLEGSHHSHLNNPEHSSELINQFIDRHYCKDDFSEGIRTDIIVDKRKSYLPEI